MGSHTTETVEVASFSKDGKAMGCYPGDPRSPAESALVETMNARERKREKMAANKKLLAWRAYHERWLLNIRDELDRIAAESTEPGNTPIRWQIKVERWIHKHTNGYAYALVQLLPPNPRKRRRAQPVTSLYGLFFRHSRQHLYFWVKLGTHSDTGGAQFPRVDVPPNSRIVAPNLVP